MKTVGKIINLIPRSGNTWVERSRSIIAILTEATGLMLIILLGFSFSWLGYDQQALIYWIFAGLLATNLVIGPILQKIALAKFNATTMMLVMPFVLMFFFGGFTILGVSAGILSLAAPMIAMLLIRRQSALIWTAGAVLLMFVMVPLQPYASQFDPHIPFQVAKWFVAVHLILLILMFSGLGYIVTGRLEEANQRADVLLLNVLPASIVEQFKEHPVTIADYFESASVLFADIVGFTPLSSQKPAVEVVDLLNKVFSYFDLLVAKYGLEKIRTIGDSYMIASGVPVPRPDHAQALAVMALEMLDYTRKNPILADEELKFRIGINSGPMIGGVIGTMKFQYDVWGDTVNISNRMESHGLPGKIQISAATYDLIKDEFLCERRGLLDIKGKGQMETYFLLGRKDGLGS